MSDEDPGNVVSPEQAAARDARAKALRDAEVAQYLSGSDWLNNIEPEAKAYYEFSQRAEQALMLSLAISLMRMAGPLVGATARGFSEVDPVRSAEDAPSGVQRTLAKLVAGARDKVAKRVSAAGKKSKNRKHKVGKRRGKQSGRSAFTEG